MQNEYIAGRIKEICKSKNITVSSLLNECRINRNFIYDLKKRNKSPSADKIIRIADYFGCSTDYLFGRTDNPEINK